MQARHHSSRRDRKCLGYLLVSHVFNVRKNNYLLKLLWYTLERSQDFLFCNILRRWRVESYCFCDLLFDITYHTQATLVAPPFAERVVHDLYQPGTTIGAYFETMKGV